MTDYKTHVNEAIEALGQYLGCVAANRMIGWGEESLRDRQHQSRRSMIAVMPCPACAAIGNLFQHGNHDQ